MRGHTPTRLILAATLGLLSAAVASRFPAAQRRPYDLSAIPGARASRLASAGHPTLVANLWWLRAVQYMGDDQADARGWDRLFPAADLITDLDPRHGYAYHVAGIMLGAGGRVEESNALFEKGFRNLPQRYTLAFQRAVNAFLYQGDYVEAARWFEAASRAPGAPAERMRSFAAAMLVKGNRHDAAMAILTDSLRSAQDDGSRKAIQRQMDQVELEWRATTVERAVTAYRARNGANPPLLEMLVLQGYLDRIPEDPFGGVLILDAEGRVRSSVNSYRYQPQMTDRERAAHQGALQSQTRELTERPPP